MRIKIVGTVLLVAVALLCLSEFNRGRSQHNLMEDVSCTIQMVNAVNALHFYIDANGDVPRDANGGFDADLLICDRSRSSASCVSHMDTACPLCDSDDVDWCGYVWPKVFSVDSIDEMYKFNGRRTVVLVHDIEVDHGTKRGKRIVYFVLGNGVVIGEPIERATYHKWLTSFRAGDLRIPAFLDTHDDNSDRPSTETTVGGNEVQ